MPLVSSILNDNNKFVNKFAFPAGMKPGFDPTHPAAQNPRGVFVPISNNFINLLTAKVGLKEATVTPIIDAIIGPALQSTANGGDIKFSAAGTNDSVITLAGIIRFAVFGTQANTIIETSDSNGWALKISNAGHPQIINNNTSGTLTSTLTLTAGVPYFVAASCGITTTNMGRVFIITNLLTGQIFFDGPSGTGNGASSAATTGSFFMSAAQAGATVATAVAMSSGTYLSLAQLQAWAADPWSFWYPRTIIDWVGIVAAGGFKPYWAMNKAFINEGVAF